jgi:hypothetical protein
MGVGDSSSDVFSPRQNKTCPLPRNLSTSKRKELKNPEIT